MSIAYGYRDSTIHIPFLFQFYYNTTPIVGTLDELLTKIDNAAVDRVIKRCLQHLPRMCTQYVI